MTWSPFRTVPVGASREVLDHHGSLHGCPPAPPVDRVCPCRGCIAICCGVCDTIVFAVAPTGAVMCEHLAELLEGVPT